MKKKLYLIAAIMCFAISTLANIVYAQEQGAVQQTLNQEQQKAQQSAQLEEGIYVLVSFSMNDAALRKYFIEAQSVGAKLILRGLVGQRGDRNRFATTKARIERARINVEINPNLFEHLNAKHVPVIAVVAKDKKHGKIVKQISGHISLQKALEMMEVDVKQKAA